jgi:hypothetical protein
MELKKYEQKKDLINTKESILDFYIILLLSKVLSLYTIV